jgi:hypothetical protein
MIEAPGHRSDSAAHWHAGPPAAVAGLSWAGPSAEAARPTGSAGAGAGAAAAAAPQQQLVHPRAMYGGGDQHS